MSVEPHYDFFLSAVLHYGPFDGELLKVFGSRDVILMPAPKKYSDADNQLLPDGNNLLIYKKIKPGVYAYFGPLTVDAVLKAAKGEI